MADNVVKNLVPVLVKDIVPPVAVYYVLHAAGANDWVALLGGTLISGGVMIAEAVRARRLEVFSGVMLGIFGIGLIAAVLFDDPRFVILKASLTSAVVGIAFLASCLFGKPLTYLAYRRAVGSNPAEAAELEQKYRQNRQLRMVMRSLSLLWGFGLLAESIARAVLAYQLPVSTMVGLSTVLSIGTIAVLFLITVRVAKQAKRIPVPA
ncbi:Na+/melibiose symporter-like transporter [Kibdelosporangium banguiense]|uniref:Na+/melibiose symporter-like transporter n=1 Tax=Kibdelosporangium banguiense TaxID=1365924 RepID=A0ABS4TR91_9PSEU|nr:VC0807 family protein [Kibdelosporangium banguiense]MBP2326924.1 Na+/melibiose symporter-like transporter [Kibdelosporangium banguiense]